MFSWLDYEENKDVVFCHVCRKADQNQQLNVQSKEPAFIKSGFFKLERSLEVMKKHLSSCCY